MAFALPTGSCDEGGFLYCLALWANEVTGGRFWTLAALAFMIAMFLATQRFGTPRSYGFASVVGLMVSVFLVVLNLMSYWVASMFIINGVIGFAVMILNER